MSSINLTITPINKKLTSISNIDFREQLSLAEKGESCWCWDDTKYNKAKKGEYFAFMFYGEKVIIHRITSVKSPLERPPYWSSNVGQTNRNVLELSLPLKEITWTEWEYYNIGPKAHMGTYTINTGDEYWPKLFKILESLEGEVDTKRDDTISVSDKNIEHNRCLEDENVALKQEVEKLKQALYVMTNLYYSK